MKLSRYFLIIFVTLHSTNLFSMRQQPMPLQNLGNRCYFNSVLQCLLRLNKFNTFLRNPYSGSNLTSNFYKNVYENRNHATYFQPSVNSLFDNLGFNQDQQDVVELLEIFLQKMPPGIDNYKIALRQVFNCPDCGYHSVQAFALPAMLQGQDWYDVNTVQTYAPYNILSLVIPENNRSLTDCLNEFFAETNVELGCNNTRQDPIAYDEEEGELLLGLPYRCDGMRRTKKFTPFNTPPVLILQLKRFDEYGNKIGYAIPFPLTNFQYNNTYYRLMSFVCHSGSLQGGHYIAYVRSGNAWYKCDDENINQVDLTQQHQALQVYTPYLFFYEKLDAQDNSPEAGVIIGGEQRQPQQIRQSQPVRPSSVTKKSPTQTTTLTSLPQVTEEDKERIKKLEKQLAIITPFKDGKLTAAGKLILNDLEKAKKMYFDSKNKNAVAEWEKLFKKVNQNWQDLCNQK